MSKNNAKPNKKNEDECCQNCGGSKFESGDSHYHCVECGIQHQQLGYDNGYKFPSERDSSRIANHVSALGSQIKPEKGSKIAKKIIQLQKRESYRRLTYSEAICEQIEKAGEPSKVVIDVKKLLDKANEVRGISINRDKMKGKPKNKVEGSEYRKRVYAAAALVINADLGSENRANQLVAEWKIDRNDLAKAIKTIEKHLRRNIPVNHSLHRRSPNDNSHENRRKLLTLQISTIRDHLRTFLGPKSSRELTERAVSLLMKHGEPMEYGQEAMNSGRYCNDNPDKAAMRAVVHAMIELGFETTDARELYALFPVVGMKSFFNRIAIVFRDYPTQVW